MRIRFLWCLAMAVCVAPPLAAQQTQRESELPAVAGMSIVLAVAGEEARGDHEFVIAVTLLTMDAIALSAAFDGAPGRDGARCTRRSIRDRT